MKSSRKSHHKSRTGCADCKRRKIKCDEQKPACKNCIKHGIDCDFLSKSSTVSASGSSYYSASDGLGACSNASRSQNSTPVPENGLNSSMNMMDLELLHNYSTSTCFTLSRSPVMTDLWRINVPQLAFSHEFVMHAILALSAMHLARFKVNKSELYKSEAAAHHQIGLRIAAKLLTQITEENCTALHIFSSITCIIALAQPQCPESLFLVRNQGVEEWLLLLRGTRTIFHSSSEWLCVGSLAPMFQIPSRLEIQRRAAGPIAENDHLADLRRLIVETVTDSATSHIYIDSINQLQESFDSFFYSNPGCGGTSEIFCWVFRISDEYIYLLKKREQEALAILAFFCVLLKQLDSLWWMQGWSTHLISRIYYLLTAEHRLWIRWPIEQIGWIPH